MVIQVTISIMNFGKLSIYKNSFKLHFNKKAPLPEHTEGFDKGARVVKYQKPMNPRG